MTDKDEAPSETTEYGFRFGAALVERAANLGHGRVVVRVTTPKGTLDVYATKTGKMRVFLGDQEISREARIER